MAGKKGQITIFIILSLLIVAAVLIYLLLVKSPISKTRPITGLSFDECVRNAARASIKSLEENLGIEKDGFFYRHKGKDVPYLCYTDEFYKTCTVQKAVLTNSFRRALDNAIEKKIQECYSSNIDDLRAQGYEVREGNVNFKTNLELDRVGILVEAPTVIDKKKFSRIEVNLNSPIYVLLILATSIIQQESRFGKADLDVMSIYYPDYIFTRTKSGDGTSIYTIKYRKSDDKITFASRSLLWPQGYYA